MIKRIKLKFDPKLCALAGTGYGKQTYIDQVRNNIKGNEKTIIEFPKQIKTVSSSFIGGFLNELVKEIGMYNYEGYVSFAGNDFVIDKFYNYFK